ncbi:MAG: hypothetical protein HQL80_03565 [Magnetococcales bacterium]|nr:hypothetical protein [Magnetococcales bacterium]
MPNRLAYFRLCLALGVLHPDQLLSRLSAAQLADWLAYMRLEGLPDARADFGVGQITALLANQLQGNRGQPIRMKDVMPWLDVERPGHGVAQDPVSRSNSIKELLFGRSQ